jgi:trehalose 6-phosphate phosphatase
MKSILDEAQREVLERLCRSSVLLGFDFDGTLAPIVADPDAACVRASTRRLLVELAGLYPCVVISGRAVRDVEQRLRGVALRAVIGNHGLESATSGNGTPGNGTLGVVQLVKGWRKNLEPVVAGLEGVELEDKGHSLAIHYRRSRHKEKALAELERALATLGDMRLIGGKQVLNVLPLGAPHKGTALESERRRLGCDTAFFIGDDETDEDVFGEERPGLLTVRVGASTTSRAHYCLEDQAEIDALLERLAAFRR